MKKAELLARSRSYVQDVFLPGLNASVTQFHAVNYAKKRLQAAGYQELKERDDWTLQGGQGYYLTRNNSTIVGFKVSGNVGTPSLYKVIGCHTDSPVLKLAPNSALRDRNGFNQLNVQTYGGGLWHTWFDRDLTLAGKVIVKSANNKVFSLYWHAKD